MSSPLLRLKQFNVTPIGRPKSRYNSSPSPDCHDDGRFVVVTIRRNSLRYPARLPAGGGIASVFSRLVANRIAPDTHRVQAIGDVLSIALAAVPPQRNVGARQGPMGFRTVAVACATPVKDGSLPGRAGHLQTAGGARRWPNQNHGFSPVTLPGSFPLPHFFSQSSGLPQMACAPVACNSRRAPACVPAP